jgi:HD-like signal output (HDOD) protein
MCAALPSFITRAPQDLAGWVSLFDHHSLPVLDSTVDIIEQLGCNEDAVDAHLLAEALEPDPLITLKLLAHVGELRHARQRDLGGDTETVTEALVMLGIPPFFRAFGACAAVGECLSAHPHAEAGFARVLSRSHRASRFAVGFAVHRMDHDVPVIGEAALLHDFAELLLWLRAPDLAQQIAQRQAAAPGLRSADVQRQVLNIELPQLQHALMLRWHLPELLVRITDLQHRDAQQVRNVHLAIRVARHSAKGWDDAALPDDVRDVADLLNMGLEPTWRLLRDLDVESSSKGGGEAME